MTDTLIGWKGELEELEISPKTKLAVLQQLLATTENVEVINFLEKKILQEMTTIILSKII